MCVQLLPKALTDEQENYRVKMCQELLDCIRDDPNFLENILTGDDS